MITGFILSFAGGALIGASMWRLPVWYGGVLAGVFGVAATGICIAIGLP